MLCSLYKNSTFSIASNAIISEVGHIFLASLVHDKTLEPISYIILGVKSIDSFFRKSM